MSDPFVHLHVASGYSMQYGANHPADLVVRAAEHGMPALALTDRDGLYGAVKFALACRAVQECGWALLSLRSRAQRDPTALGFRFFHQIHVLDARQPPFQIIRLAALLGELIKLS